MLNKYLYFILGFILVSQATLFAQPYIINDYHVKIEIKPDGFVQVSETIEVEFNEKRRGIYRHIPTTYKNPSASGDAIIIDQIEVVNDPFVVMHERGAIRIRIGSPDVYLDGKKTYKISYQVLGTVEQFEDWAEFSWDIIGDEWDTKIRHASAEIQFPYPITSRESDILLYKGRKELKLNSDRLQLTRDRMTLEVDETFRSGTGLSLALRFRSHEFPLQKIPAAVLSEYFYVQRANMHLDLHPNGDVLVEENYRVRLKGEQAFFVRSLDAYGYVSDDYNEIYPFPDLVKGQKKQEDIPLDVRGTDGGYRIGYLLRDDQDPIRLKYLMRGSVVNNDGIRWHIDAGNFGSRVAVDTLDLHFSVPPEVSIASSPKLPGYKLIHHTSNNYTFVRTDFLTGPKQFKIQVEGLSSDDLRYPRECLYATVMTDAIHFQVHLLENGRALVEEEMVYNRKLATGDDVFNIGSETKHTDFPYPITGYNLLNRSSDFHVDLVDVHPGFEGSAHTIRSNESPKIGSNRFYTSYETDFKYAEGQLILPVFSLPETPIDRVDIEVLSTEGEEVVSHAWSENFKNDDERSAEIFKNRGNRFLAIPLNASDVPMMTFGSKAGHFIQSNLYLLIALGFCVLLYFLWYKYGRDIPYRGELSSEPPAYITPAEAGYLWDGRLHGRDMISLIYHWGARGFLLIEEVDKDGKPDYILEKVKDLPESALSYERILFDKLFEIGQTRVRISSLRESFYSTMSKARKALKEEFEKRHLYRKWTRGLGTTCLVIGIIVLINGLVSLGIGISNGDLTYGIPTIIIGISLIIFGYLLPQKTVLGSQFFHGLKSFDAFMEVAKPEQLKELYESDSRYFQNTLAYAIVLGKAKDWAARFNGLITSPPTYYRGGNSSDFSTIIFADTVISGMRHMETDLYSRPAPSGSSSGSFSGGGSSSFGGGFSGGGGFGGGGGSSW